MLDKFQKLFGPNATHANAEASETSFSSASFGVADPRKAARARMRRRIFGFIAFVLLLAAVLPWLFEPNESFLQGAKTEIPKMTRNTAVSQRMRIEPKGPVMRDESSKAAEVAKNLSQANPQPAKKAAPAQDKPVAKTSSAAHPTPKARVTKPSAKVGKPTKASSTKIETKMAPIEMRQAKTANTVYFIQILASSNKATAEERAQRIRRLGLPVYIEKTVRHNANIWRVRVGRFNSEASAKNALDTLALNSVANGGIKTEKTN